MSYSMSFAANEKKDDYCLSRQPCSMMKEQLRISEKQLQQPTHNEEEKYQKTHNNLPQQQKKKNEYATVAFTTGCMLTALETEEMLSRSLLLRNERI
mmetsp:Transcript_19727/g.29283  ORF Transcript_19727/g.29283 Transcript_19727/m.29283 type:complete len:97 (-) Transcript_19727:195-485(-)